MDDLPLANHETDDTAIIQPAASNYISYHLPLPSQKPVKMQVVKLLFKGAAFSLDRH
jgi:hypothetical protein